ncbi:hemolysin family protein [Deinococcus frigens]|uniref:hemolysin family protein n=1 Tax=Deinococcus frigens TaxID=249403 RepID=UPI000497B932|nr:hemolysin family protein [Deinococcus frigens]
MSVVLTLAVILIMVGFNALYVAAEFSTVGSRRSWVQAAAEGGNPAAAALLDILNDPRRLDTYVAACQIGITLSSLVAGSFGQARLTPLLTPVLGAVGGPVAATVTVLIFITVLQVVLGELLPKTVALRYPERLAVAMLRPLQLSLLLFRPLIALFNALALGLMRLLRIREPGEGALLYTSKELSIVTEESADGSQLGQQQRDLIQNIFALEDRDAEELMTPRRSLEALPLAASADEVLGWLARSPRSRYPVFDGELDHVVGVLHIKDFIRARTQGRPLDLASLMRPLPSVTASAPAEDLLTLFKHGRAHAALVVDEFGGTLGFVALDDLIEDVMDSGPETGDGWIQVNPDGSWHLNGEVTLSDLRGDHGLDLHSGEATTVAGLLLNAHGTVPPPGTVIHIQGHELTAEATEGLKITRVHLRRLDEGEQAGADQVSGRAEH